MESGSVAINAKRSPIRFDEITSSMASWLVRVCVCALAGFLLVTLYAIFADRFMFADGSAFFLGLIEDGEFKYGGRPARAVADWVTQLPLLAAVWAGVTSFPLLKFIYSVSLFGSYLVCIAVWWWVTPSYRQYLAFLVVFLFGCALNSNFFAISESHFAAAMFFAQVPLLLFPHTSRAMLIALCVLAAISIATYETMLLYSPVLCVLAFLRLRETVGGDRRVLCVLLGWYVVIFLYCLREILFPFDPEYTSNGFRQQLFEHVFDQIFGFLRGNPDLHFGALISLMAGSLLVLTFALRGRFAGFGFWLNAGYLIVATAITIALFIYPAQLEVRHHGQARVLQAIVPPMIALCMLCFRKGWLLVPVHWMRQVAATLAVLVLFQFVWQLHATWQWTGYLAHYRHVVTTHSGMMWFDESPLEVRRIGQQAIGTMNWGWTVSLMSILVAPKEFTAILYERDEKWPIDPANPETLPNLARYGVDYSRYLKARESQIEAKVH